jgi:hypothetical protein
MQLVINTMIDKNRTKRSHAFYRVSTSRKLHGLEDLPPKIDKHQTIADATSLLSQLQATGALDEDPELGKHSVVNDQNLLVVRRMHFSSREYAVVESSGQVQMAVRRPVTGPQHVRVVSRDGTAKVKDDYKHIDIILDFGGSNEVIFSVDIVSDNTYEETEHFFVDLYPVDAEDLARAQESSSSKVEMITNDDSTNDGMVTGSTKVTLTLDTKGPAQKNTNMRSSKVSPMGVTEPKRRSSSFDNIKTKVKPLDTTKVIIIDDSSPGVLYFSKEQYVCCESEKKVTITVNRKAGSKGKVSCKVKTVDREAVSPDDFIAIPEDDPMILVFDNEELTKSFDIEIIDDQVYEKDETFDVVLFDVEGGASLGDRTYEEEELSTNVVIISDEKERRVVDEMAQLFSINYGRVRIGSIKYSQQFIEAIFPGGNRNCKASAGTWILHILAMPWRLIFALIPPVDLAGGWVTFFLALTGIAGYVFYYFVNA